MHDFESQCSSPSDDASISSSVPQPQNINQVTDFFKSAYEQKTKEVNLFLAFKKI